MQLRDYLTSNGLTQQAFGLLMDPPVSQGKVNHWLQGTRRVSLVEALQIQRVTCGAVSVEELAGIEKNLQKKTAHQARVAINSEAMEAV